VIFTSFVFVTFLIVVLMAYWSLNRQNQNLFLLVSSFIFYGFVTPWICLLLASSIIVDFFCGKAIYVDRSNNKKYLFISIAFNLTLLAVFKYFNFFIESITRFFALFDMHPSLTVLNIALPVGISFYTFQTLSYTIDIYRGKLKPTSDFISFAVFVSFFPQLVAGPIERASNMLPQILSDRDIDGSDIRSGIYLIMRGFVKKLVVADNIAVYVDKIFLLEQAGVLMVAVGSIGFGLQIYADFSAYTDIARGTAKLLGIRLMENFRSPYFAWSPSEFWRRWHISLSTWIRDYLYIPLGGSRAKSRARLLMILIITMALSGLWHGADWHFVAWGIYHGFLLVIYHSIGFTGNTAPANRLGHLAAVGIMFVLTVVGWSLFRTPDLGWLYSSVQGTQATLSDNINNAVYLIALFIFYALPLGFYKFSLHKIKLDSLWILLCILLPLVVIVIFHRDSANAFIYFQF